MKIQPKNIYKVCSNSSSKKSSKSCIILDNGYSNHLYSIQSGELKIAQASSHLFFNNFSNRLRGENNENNAFYLSSKNSNSNVSSRLIYKRKKIIIKIFLVFLWIELNPLSHI